jgi:hypothetical protein
MRHFVRAIKEDTSPAGSAKEQCFVRHKFFQPGGGRQLLGLLHELVPPAIRVAVLVNSDRSYGRRDDIA